MSRMQLKIVQDQVAYWQKEAERLRIASKNAAITAITWQARAEDVIWEAWNGDTRFKWMSWDGGAWRRTEDDNLYKAKCGDHSLYMQKSGGLWQWFIRCADKTMIAGSVSPLDNEVDAIAELIAYYDQFIEKKAAVNG